MINDDNSKKVIVVTTKAREIDEHGVSHYSSTKDLIVYPKQVGVKTKRKTFSENYSKNKKIFCERKDL